MSGIVQCGALKAMEFCGSGSGGNFVRYHSLPDTVYCDDAPFLKHAISMLGNAVRWNIAPLVIRRKLVEHRQQFVPLVIKAMV